MKETDESLAHYLQLHYVESIVKQTEILENTGKIKDAGKNFSLQESLTLDQLLERVGMSFREKLFFKLTEVG